jgi:heme-degrading monooxygenase HmoA
VRQFREAKISQDLGKTSALLATEEENTNTLAWISYWKTLEQLQAFANGDSHRRGWDAIVGLDRKLQVDVVYYTRLSP